MTNIFVKIPIKQIENINILIDDLIECLHKLQYKKTHITGEFAEIAFESKCSENYNSIYYKFSSVLKDNGVTTFSIDVLESK